MKIQTAGFFSLLAVLGAMTAISSCSKTDYVAGLWQGNPEHIVSIPSASDATSTITIDFAPRSDKKGQGQVDLNAVIEVQQAVVGSLVDMQSPYQANITATASISGYYAPEKGEDDDFILSFDASSLKVNVDPSGVVFVNDAVSNMERPVLDSLTTATADQWRVILTKVMREEFYKFSRIEDVEVHHNDMMSMEIDNHDKVFRRIAQN
ncbi:MAG: hypothetical protein J6C95_00995 [Muribaculaceae bacterium]|nr:hypothetical protein [Muribaculaceae bacterium]